MGSPIRSCAVTFAVAVVLLPGSAGAVSKFTLQVLGAATEGRYVQTSPATTYCNPAGYGVTCRTSPGVTV
jgi:hypothetical protein